MAKKETGETIIKDMMKAFAESGQTPPKQIQQEYDKIVEEEVKLLAEKKAAAAQRRKELKEERQAEKIAHEAALKVSKDLKDLSNKESNNLKKLKEKIAKSEQILQQKVPEVSEPETPSIPSTPPAQSTPPSQKAATGGFLSDALESAAESDYNKKDTKEGRKKLLSIGKSLAKNLIYKPIAGTVKAVGLAAGGILSSEYMGLSGPVAAGLAGYNWLTGSDGKNKSRNRGSKALSSVLGMGDKPSKDTPELSILKRILDNTETTNERLEDVAAALERQESSSQEDRRELKQQNDQIIGLLQQIANNTRNGNRGNGASGEGGVSRSNGGSWWDKLKDGMGWLGGALGIGALFKGGKNLAIKAARFAGSRLAKGANFVKNSVASLFGKGEAKSAETVGEIAAKTGEQVGETGAKLEGKEGGKAAEKILAKEGGEAVVESGAKAAGKGGIKAIVAKVIGPKVAKVIAKGIPFVGALAGLGFGIARAMEGDWKGAGAEVAGGTASIFPGVGTAASVATDVGLLARDVYKEAYGVFPEDDPLVGERLDEVKKEVMDYIDGTVSAKETAAAPGAVNPNAPTASDNAGAASVGTVTPPSITPEQSAPGLIPTSSISPVTNPAVGFNQGSTQMALLNNTTPPPVIINNNNVASSGGGGSGGRGPAPSRSGGVPSTSPKQSHIDRALYGDLYGAGVP